MSDQDSLRDRLKSRICQQTGCHIDDAEMAAQAIIDEFGLTHGYRTAYNQDHPDGENQKRIVGKWEKQ